MRREREEKILKGKMIKGIRSEREKVKQRGRERKRENKGRKKERE